MTYVSDPCDRAGSTLLVTRRFLFGGLALLLLIRCIKYAQLASGATEPYLVDFDVFYIVSQLVQDGFVEKAYSFTSMLEAQARYGPARSFMPWTYPPPYNIVVAPLALLPIWLAHFLFAGLTLAAYLVVLGKLSGTAFTPVLLAVFPALGVNILLGQNGSLTGALIGVSVLLLLRSSSAAGIPLGLMIIKPHLAIGLGFYVLAAKRWGTAITATSVALLACAAATIAFGFGVWPAFFEAAQEAGRFLGRDFYHLHRMSSIYASARSFNMPLPAAATLQAVSALIAIGAIILAARSSLKMRYQIGAAIAASFFITPYSYTYDMPAFGVAAAIFAPVLLCRASSFEKAALLILSWTACLWGVIAPAMTGPGHGGNAGPSGPAIALAALVLIAWRILRRPSPSMSGKQ